MSAVRAGVDIGGTFTDVALAHPGGLATAKVLTDHDAPEGAIMDGLARAAEAAGLPLGAVGQVIHGTTLVTNALIERRGARVAFVTTEGFRDVIEMRSENRFEQYDLNLVLPEPLVPRADRLTVPERIGPGGEVLRALDEGALAHAAERVAAGGYGAVAVGLMHAYANGAHERRVAEVVAEAAPGLPISLSSVVAPRMRELPRFNTTIANAYVQPVVARYLRRLVERLRAEGVAAPVFMLHSAGGLVSVETAAAQPVRLLESGPAGGAIFAAGYARAHGIDRALSFDMGGTTAKLCLVEGGRPRTAATFEVARSYRFKKGSGMLVATPVVEMVEIGAGGGSLAGVDAMGRIRVGPRSAGSAPGPACYGRGGAEPAVTDANLLLGRLDADGFAGGAIPLSVPAAERALRDRVAEPLGIALAEAAFGVTETVDESMANAARVHAIENGEDVERFTMVAFGGGAPLHAARLCEKLGVRDLVVPPGAGVGSAIGFLRAPFGYEAGRGHFSRLDAFDAAAVNAVLDDMEREARGFASEGAGGAPLEAALTAHMRYAGQGWEIPVPLPPERFEAGDAATILAAFEAAYRALFGRTIAGLAVEITNWSLAVATVPPPVAPVRRAAPETAAPVLRTRTVFDAALRRAVEAREVARAAMGPGVYVDGPALVIEDETTTVVAAAFRAVGQADGSLWLHRREEVP